MYNLPLYYQVVLNLPTAKAGIRLLPISIGISLGSLGYGLLMAKTVRFRLKDVSNNRDIITGSGCHRTPFRYLELD
jgi:hypothetical protein